ncbi:MAG: esterase [Salinarimonadaceae bacterium]|nr:MAG: esterase [Salinarimonadaceae bacterium]
MRGLGQEGAQEGPQEGAKEGAKEGGPLARFIEAARRRVAETLTGVERTRATDWDGLAEAIRSGAAYLAQGSVYSYLRARTGMAGPRLFQDEGFAFALDICKWEGFACAAQDLILILEGDLRAMDLGPRDRLEESLVALYEAALAREPAPAHRAKQGWSDVIAEFRLRLADALAAPPRKAEDISAATARRLMQHAPVEEAIRVSDIGMVLNNVGFRFVDYKRRMREDIDYPAIAAAIAARASDAP